jgi:oligopeptide/dipeptide ABC transporter ATP-binding protein
LAHGIGTPQSRREKAVEMLELVGLDASYADRLPRELSGGQRQRVCIGAALMIDPDLVIADEATSALDVSVGAQILNLFQEIHDRKDFAMLFISHNLNVVYYLCNRIAVMYRGSIVEQGDAESLYNAPLHPYTRTLLSAIPEIDAGDELSRYAYQETRREPAPDGCDFYHRCPYATDQCKKRPELTDALAAENGTDASEKEREHLVRCWNPVRSD